MVCQCQSLNVHMNVYPGVPICAYSWTGPMFLPYLRGIPISAGFPGIPHCILSLYFLFPFGTHIHKGCAHDKGKLVVHPLTVSLEEHKLLPVPLRLILGPVSLETCANQRTN